MGKSNAYFRFEIFKKIVTSMVNQERIHLDYMVYDRIILDLRSLYSVIYRYMMQVYKPWDERSITIKDCVSELTNHLTVFILETVANNDVRLNILYSFEPDEEREKIFAKWEYERMNRIKLGGLIEKELRESLISKLLTLSNSREDVSLINYGKLPGDVIVDRYVRTYPATSKILVLTRNTGWYGLLRHSSVDIFNAVDLLFGGSRYKDNISRTLPKIAPSWLPLFYTISGDRRRNEYPGAERYGTKRTIKYFIENRDRIVEFVKNKDYEFLSNELKLNKFYICLYDQSLMYEYLSDLTDKTAVNEINNKVKECV